MISENLVFAVAGLVMYLPLIYYNIRIIDGIQGSPVENLSRYPGKNGQRAMRLMVVGQLIAAIGLILGLHPNFPSYTVFIGTLVSIATIINLYRTLANKTRETTAYAGH